MKKRLLILALAVIMCFSIVACSDQKAETPENSKQPASETAGKDVKEPSAEDGPFTPYEETITLTYGKDVNPSEQLGEGETHEVNQYTRHILNELNIETKTYWQVAQGQDSLQKINLAIASNDLPDAMVVNSTQLYQLVKSDQLADLTDVYETYASDTIKYTMDTAGDIAKNSVTFDGKMMAIPAVNVPEDGYHFMWVRQDWLDKLNLPVPKTVEDLKNVAKAFVEQDPDGNGENDTIGLAGPANGGKLFANFLFPTNNLMGFDAFFGAFQSYPGYWLDDGNGNAVYGSLLPETKSALAELANMYKAGLIDPQMGVRKDANEEVVGGKCGLFLGVWWMGYWPFPDAWANDPEADFQAYPLYAEDGNTYFHMGTPSTTFCVVRKGYEHPEAAMKIANLYCRDEGVFDQSISQIGNYPLRVPITPYDELKFTTQAVKDVLNGEKTLDDYSDFEKKIYRHLTHDTETAPLVKLEPLDEMGIKNWDLNGDSNVNRLYSMLVGCRPIYDEATNKKEVFSLIYSQTDSMASRWANLEKIEQEAFMKIIMGKEPIEYFDTFVQEWLKQGGEKITAEVQEARK